MRVCGLGSMGTRHNQETKKTMEEGEDVTSNVAFAIKHVEEFVLWSDKSMVSNGTDAL